MPYIYVIGDSHSLFWSGLHGVQNRTLVYDIKVPPKQNKFFRVFNLGPCLAFNMNRYGAQAHGREKVDFLIQNRLIPLHSTIMVCFGEIDIRVHILKNGANEMSQRIAALARNYLEFMNSLKRSGFDIICWGPIASQKDEWKSDPNYPRHGTEVQRNSANRILSLILEEACKQNTIRFVSIFEDMVTNEFTTRSEFICDQCHLGSDFFDFACDKLYKNAGLEALIDRSAYDKFRLQGESQTDYFSHSPSLASSNVS